jgi:cytochrome c oxidase assembly factor CtaG
MTGFKTIHNHASAWNNSSFIIIIIIIIIIIWFVRLLALRPLLAYCASLGW